MSKICIFGGTTEGRKLAEFLSGQPCDVMVCVATDYGQTLLPEAEHVSVSARRLPVGEIVSLLTEHRFDLVIDATHPYAQSITKKYCARLPGDGNAPLAAAARRVRRFSGAYLRGRPSPGRGGVSVWDRGQYSAYNRQQGWRDFRSFPGFSERVWARVLPYRSSLDACAQAGLPASHIFAMQGPFSEAMNTAMLEPSARSILSRRTAARRAGLRKRNPPPKARAHVWS